MRLSEGSRRCDAPLVKHNIALERSSIGLEYLLSCCGDLHRPQHYAVLSLPVQAHVSNLVPRPLPILNQLLWLLQAVDPSYRLLHSDDASVGGIPSTLPKPLREVFRSPDPGLVALRLGRAVESAGYQRWYAPPMDHRVAWERSIDRRKAPASLLWRSASPAAS
jgi:hypothetical protein